MIEPAGEARKVWTVSELNRAVRENLEESFPTVWVEGEISNFRLAPSGHAYFSLKDQDSQIPAAMFRFTGRRLRFEVKDGLAVVAGATLTLYEKRGLYQLIIEGLEPKGKGALQEAFEQLKAKLREEGLFDEERKKPLPPFPKKIGVVTSPTGAAVRDILNVIGRRFGTVHILINPVRVQGEGAAGEIAAAIGELSAREDIDVIIVGRGGGSIEDLWAFNEEPVARAISTSTVPVISAVGHETDFTIADFVADVRAPTPSAAAELVVRSKDDLAENVRALSLRLGNAVTAGIESARQRKESLAAHRMVSDQRRRMNDLSQRVDDLGQESRRCIEAALERRRTDLSRLSGAIDHLSPRLRLDALRRTFTRVFEGLVLGARRGLEFRKERSLRLVAGLDALSPLAVLSRGYSICRQVPTMEVIRDAAAVRSESEVQIRLHRGELRCQVTGIDVESERPGD